jgi:hypothetical protein
MGVGWISKSVAHVWGLRVPRGSGAQDGVTRGLSLLSGHKDLRVRVSNQ